MNLDEEKAKLFPLLQKALELELSTIPPYLTALLSIKKEKNRVAADLIRSVMMEEMLHMALVGNLMSSLGGKVSLREKNIPSYPLRMQFKDKPFQDRDFDVDLEAFSPRSVATFKQIELPTSFIPKEMPFEAAFDEILIPGITIGAFYKIILARLSKMCEEFPEGAVFCGDPRRQVNQQYYWGAGGQPIVITGLRKAEEAVDLIIEQGEGAEDSVFDEDEHYFDEPNEVAHYFRFNEIAEGRRYKPGDKPKDPPTGAPFEVDYAAVFPILKNAKSYSYKPGSHLATLNDTFNRQYSLMLIQLEQAFNGAPWVLYDAILNGMHGLASTGLEMVALPISDPHGPNGAPTFEWVQPPVLD